MQSHNMWSFLYFLILCSNLYYFFPSACFRFGLLFFPPSFLKWKKAIGFKYSSLKKKLYIYIYIYICWVLVAACGI